MGTSVVDRGDDVEAVRRAIEAETRAFYAKDFDALSRRWMHEPWIRRLGWWTRGGVSDRSGWEEIGDRTHQLFLDHPEHNVSGENIRRENLVIRVSGDMAWATFDQYAPDTGEPDMDMPGLSREARVLERHDGEWRIVYLSYIHQTAEPSRPAMIRVSGEGMVSWTNSSAQKLLASMGSVRVVGGKLAALNKRDNTRLQAAIADASARDLTLDGGRAANPVVIESEESEELSVCWVLTEGSGTGAVLVSINNLAFAQDQLDAAARAFSLSSSQQRVAEMVVSGADLVQAAQRLGIQVSTARTHLQRIFEKTGVRNQAALVRTLLNAAPPA
jgi:DNA-binding CsgD family transcriptional regulator